MMACWAMGESVGLRIYFWFCFVELVNWFTF